MERTNGAIKRLTGRRGENQKILYIFVAQKKNTFPRIQKHLTRYSEVTLNGHYKIHFRNRFKRHYTLLIRDVIYNASLFHYLIY